MFFLSVGIFNPKKVPVLPIMFNDYIFLAESIGEYKYSITDRRSGRAIALSNNFKNIKKAFNHLNKEGYFVFDFSILSYQAKLEWKKKEKEKLIDLLKDFNIQVGY